MWIHLDEKERALVLEALRSNCTDRPGDENDHDRLHDRLTQAIADFDPADPWRAAAQEQADDELEIDEDAVVSNGDDEGAWVHAWIWITDEQAGRFTCEECSGVFTLDRRYCSVEGICDECAAKEDACEECGEDLDDAGDGWDGKCADCADKIAAGE